MKRVLFITLGKYDDVKNWSGTVKNMYDIFDKNNFHVDVIDNLKINKTFSFIYKIINKIARKKYLLEREGYVAKSFAKQIENEIKSRNIEYDFVFTPTTLIIPYLNIQKPIMLYTDATFNSMIDYYESFSNLSNRTIKKGNKIDLLSYKKCSKCFFASEWAKEDAELFYGVNNKKLSVVNFGVNLNNTIGRERINEMISNRIDSNTLNLLFIGVDFKRKGGEIALKIVKRINELGIKSKLIIIGSNPIISKEHEKFVKIIGFLNKDHDNDLNKLMNILEESHFFVLPTRAEAFGIAFAEANAYGIPAIGTETGGVKSVIKDGENGFLFKLDSDIDEYVKKIVDTYRNKEKYVEMSKTSYEHYLTRLNWNVAATKIINEIEGYFAN